MARISKYKATRTRRRVPWRGLVIVLLTLLFVGEFLYAVFLSPLFAIKSITLKGDNSLNISDIRTLSKLTIHSRVLGIFPKDNFFLLQPKQLSAAIMEAFPRVGSVTIRQNWSSHLVEIEVEPYKEVAVWCAPTNGLTNCFYVSGSGALFAFAPKVIGNRLPVFTDNRSSRHVSLGARVVSQSELRQLLSIHSLVVADGYSIDSMTLGTANDMTVHVAKGFDIYFSLSDNPKAQISRLDQVMSQTIGADVSKLEYIDLRTGNKIFYRLKDVIQ